MAGTSSSLRGALWMGGAVLSFTAMAVSVRELQRHMGSFEIVLMRSLVMLAIVLALLPRAGVSVVKTRKLAVHVWRNAIHFLGQVLWVYSLGALTLATVFAIEFTMPVWTARLAATDSALAVLFWMALIQTPISLVAAAPQWVTPLARDIPWIILIGIGSY